MSQNLNIITFRTLESTQDNIKQNMDALPTDTVIVADTQTKGRGRFKREWISPKGGLWFSILKKDTDPTTAHIYGFIAATAVARSLKSLGFTPEMKWPNDINIDKKKVCGILVESITEASKSHTIIGIGLNVNNNPPLDTSTSLKSLSGSDNNLEDLLKKILEEFYSLDLKNVLEEWKNFWNPGPVKIHLFKEDKTIKGDAISIKEDGSLIIEKDGKKIRVDYAEII